MKLLFNSNVFGWNMTGLLGKSGAWFLGFSRQPKVPAISSSFVNLSSVNLDNFIANSPWIHTGSGNTYCIVCLSNLTATKPDFVPTVTYRDKDGVVWSRPLLEFVDKFVPQKDLRKLH